MITISCDVCGFSCGVVPGGGPPEHSCGDIPANRKPTTPRDVLAYSPRKDAWVITRIHANGEWEDDVTFWRDLPPRPGGCS